MSLGPPPRVCVVIHYSINVFGNKHVVDHLVYTLHQGVTLRGFIEVHMGIVAKSFKNK